VEGTFAPCDTPIEIVEKLNQEINAGLANPQIKARLAGLGATARQIESSSRCRLNPFVNKIRP
jgi:tripartite-type tricarboxylate transporter receptor subunit TctC